MKSLFIFAIASVGFAATLPKSQLYGDYVEARTADVYTGPCFANAEEGLTGDLAVFGWHIQKGAFEGVNLDGLSVVAAVHANNTLGGRFLDNVYPVKSVLVVDEHASLEQRLALKKFAQRMSGDLLQDIVRIEYRPISLIVEDNNVHGGKATLVAGDLAKIQTRPISNMDHVCSNEEVWYQPLTKVDHAMPAFALAHSYRGQGLGTTWSSPEKRSAFVASFHYND